MRDRRRRIGAVIGLAVLVAAVVGAVVVVVATRGGSPSSDTVRVQALWFGETADGQVRSGVTPVDITAGLDDPRTPLSVDLRGLRAAGAGPMWTAATAVAGVQAVLITGVDPRLGQLRYSLHEAIDGPSAGALLSAGSVAAIRGAALAPATTMTGTVLPDGSIGPVAGADEKLRAAARAGLERVLVPVGRAYDRRGREVDLVAIGRSLGLTVTPVASVPEAYALMAEVPKAGVAPVASARGRASPAIDARLLRMLARRSRGLIAEAEAGAAARGPAAAGAAAIGSVAAGSAATGSAATGAAATPARVSTWLRTARVALRRDDPVLAFTAAAEAAQAVAVERASRRARAMAQDVPLRVSTARVADDARRLAAAVRGRMRVIATRPVSSVEQLSALPDVLAWGNFALTSAGVAERRLASVRDVADLDEIVRFLAVARFEAATYMETTAESLDFLGRRPMADVGRAAALLDAYAELVSYAAQANRTYAEAVNVAAGDDTYLGQLIEASRALRRETAPEARALRGRGPTARAAMRMSVALLEYVETTQMVNDLTANAGPAGGPPNLAPIKDEGAVRTQATAAQTIARAQAAQATAAGLDPSYLQWNSRWGAALSLDGLPRATDEQALHGLEYQWFAVLQSRLLIALGGADA